MEAKLIQELGGTMSEQQVLPEWIATLKAAAEKATPGPWHWGIHDYSMASLTGKLEEEEHVISVSPCGSCQKGLLEPKEWEFGRCTTPTENNADYIAAASPDAILKLLASLAQSEAERERLQGAYEQSTYLLGMRVIETAALRAELTREGEANQGLREVVRFYKRTKAHELCNDPSNFVGKDFRCPICIKADALLEPQAKPVATTS